MPASVPVDLDIEVIAAHGAFGKGRGVCGTARTAASTSLPIICRVSRFAPDIFMPTGVLMPVDSMSVRVLMGMVQALVRPGNLIASSSFSMSFSGVMPLRPLFLRLEHDDGFQHVEPGRVGRGLGPARLAENPLDFRK